MKRNRDRKWSVLSDDRGAAPGIRREREWERVARHAEFAARVSWKAILGNWVRWDQPPNPYNYLDRYLNTEQLTEVYQLLKGSDTQVDKVIEFMDPDGACDDELRDLAYQLFRRANP